eukprot:220793_1
MRYDKITIERSGQFIYNYFEMNITNLNIIWFSHKYMFGNAGILMINNLNVNTTVFANNNNEWKFNPNILHSASIIYQNYESAIVYITNSIFIGSSFSIQIYSSKLFVYNSIFMDAAEAIWSNILQEAEIRNCSFYRIGKLYSNFDFAFETIDIYYTNVFILQAENTVIKNNLFRSYDAGGFIMIGWIPEFVHVLISDNEFVVDDSQIYYDIPSFEMIWDGYFYPSMAVNFWWNYGDISFINNTFDIIYDISMQRQQNHSWVSWNYNTGVCCLAGNIFPNFAFTINGSNLTSCFRKNIIKCFDYTKCIDGMYGSIDERIINTISIFNVSNNFNYLLFEASDDAFIVLDNAVIIGNPIINT